MNGFGLVGWMDGNLCGHRSAVLKSTHDNNYGCNGNDDDNDDENERTTYKYGEFRDYFSVKKGQRIRGFEGPRIRMQYPKVFLSVDVFPIPHIGSRFFALGTFAPPYFGTVAPPYFETSATPHFETVAPPYFGTFALHS